MTGSRTGYVAVERGSLTWGAIYLTLRFAIASRVISADVRGRTRKQFLSDMVDDAYGAVPLDMELRNDVRRILASAPLVVAALMFAVATVVSLAVRGLIGSESASWLVRVTAVVMSAPLAMTAPWTVRSILGKRDFEHWRDAGRVADRAPTRASQPTSTDFIVALPLCLVLVWFFLSV